MSMRDPMERLADKFLLNLADWWAEVNAKEPRTSRDHVRLKGSRGVVGNAVESFVLKRAELKEVLAAVRGVLRRLPPHLREIYRLRYVEKLSILAISERHLIGTRTIDHRLSIIRGRVAGRLTKLERPDLAEFWREIRVFLAR